MQLSKQQEIQENAYYFPYHYVVQYKDEFALACQFDWGVNYASTIEFLLKKIAEAGDIKSIIDIGCGDGRFTRELRECFSGARLVGIDYSARSIQYAKAMNADLAIDFLCTDILNDSMPDRFQVAALMEVYEHIEPDLCVQFLLGIYTLLAKDGLLHVTVPHKNIPVSSKHFRHFTVAGLTSELEKYFEILEVIPFEKRGLPRKWLLRLLINRLFILNHKGLKNYLYGYYKENLFLVKQESECQRIYVKCRKK